MRLDGCADRSDCDGALDEFDELAGVEAGRAGVVLLPPLPSPDPDATE